MIRSSDNIFLVSWSHSTTRNGDEEMTAVVLSDINRKINEVIIVATSIVPDECHLMSYDTLLGTRGRATQMINY